MFYIILLILIEIILLATNYISGTYLLGWDNILPEMNFSLNLKRSLFSIWQEYRGLGILDGMAHSANLVHTVYIYILSIFLPQSMLRYVFIHLTHLAGGIGFFYLLRHLLNSKHKSKILNPKSQTISNLQNSNDKNSNVLNFGHSNFEFVSDLDIGIWNFSSMASFLGALFYMFNLGIIQMFYAPLEVFAVHFAAIPILTLFTLKALKNTNLKNLFILFIAGFLSTPQAFVPTVFIVFGILFGAILMFHLFYTKNVKSVIIVSLIFFAANSFWALPYFYSGLKSASVIQNTRINQFSTEEIYYRNYAKGDLLNVLSLQGFMIDGVERDHINNMDLYFMEAWREHKSNFFYKLIYIAFLGISLFGLIQIILNRKKEFLPFVLAFLISFFFLANSTIVLEQLNNLIRSSLPIIGESFRFPFTKFIILFGFTLAVFLTYGINILFKNYFEFFNQKSEIQNPKSQTISNLQNSNDKNSNVLNFGHSNFEFVSDLDIGIWNLPKSILRICIKEFPKQLIFVIFFLGLFYLSFPAFKGYFTSPLLKINLPKEYLNAFSYLNSLDENQRTVIFPIHTFWNWQYRIFPPNAGQKGRNAHFGSGFLWYGIKQPTFERAFDPWSNYNEQFYNEISYALNSNNLSSFEKILEKYDIKYIFLDQYVLQTLSNQAINYDKINSILKTSSNIKLKKKLGKIAIYETGLKNSHIYSLDKKNTPNIYPGFQSSNEDTLNPDKGNYISSKNQPDIVPFFPSLSTLKLQNNLEFEIKNEKDTITLRSIVKFENQAVNGKDYLLEVPSMFNNEFLIPVKVEYSGNQLIFTPIQPQIFINKKGFSANDQKIVKSLSIKAPVSLVFADINHEINNFNTQTKSYLLNNFLNAVTVKDNDGNTETIFIDTNEMVKSSTFITFNERPINEVIVVIDKIDSPLSETNVIKKGNYDIKGADKTFVFWKTYSKANSRKENGKVILETKAAHKEIAFYNGGLYHKASFVLLAKTNYIKGLPLSFYLDNPFQHRAELETRLSKKQKENVVLIPKTEENFKGYGFHFTVKSIDKEEAISEIEEISLYPFPLDTLKQTRLIHPDFLDKNPSSKTPVKFEKTGNFLYKTDINNLTIQQPVRNASQRDAGGFNNSTIVLSQSYDEEWVAYKIKDQRSKIKNFFPFIFGEKVEDHVLVNNWANGWIIDSSKFNVQSSELILVFWPQYLQFLGFGIVVTTVLSLLVLKLRKTAAKN